jgi:hypothetical protein
MHVGLRKVKLNQGIRLIHKPDRRLLRNDLPDLITHDPDVHFGKMTPHWKGNWTRKKMGQISMAKFVHNVSINSNINQLFFHDLLGNLFGTSTSRSYKLRSRPPNLTQEESLEIWNNEYYL